MRPEDSVLLQVLASSDAIWRVPRRADWLSAGVQVMCEHRRQYHANGVPWAAGGTPAERKRRERGLLGMAGSGLIEIHDTGRRKCVKLTREGEERARALCGLPSVSDGWGFLNDLVVNAVEHPRYGVLASELWLCEPPLRDYVEGCQLDLQIVAAYAAPGAMRGWLTANSDIRGRAYYFPTPLGVDAIEQGWPEPEETPKPLEGALEVYSAEVLSCLEAMRVAKPENPSELGMIPLSASFVLNPRKGLFDA